MSNAPEPPSIYDAVPLNSGGIEAREGFDFQDHVAASFCLDLMTDPSLQEVWCETHDDVTLIRDAGSLLVEFVQVKSNDFDQLWSVAKLCERERKNTGPAGQCILEKSLAQDRCKEPCLFRVVTSRPVAGQLKVLEMQLKAPGRTNSDGTKALAALNTELSSRVSAFKSANGNDYTFWSARALWDVRHDETSVKNANILLLKKHLELVGIHLVTDQIEEIHTKLLMKVRDASRAKPSIAPEKKRILKTQFRDWLTHTAHEIGFPTAGGAPEKLREKLVRAGLADDVIYLAMEQRRRYRAEVLRPKYLSLDDRQLAEGEVVATLQGVKSKLDNGRIPDEGVAAHDNCLDALEKLRDQVPITPKPSRAFLQGCMYDIAGRCMHRFRRVTS